jgi:hypothetical protein
MHQSCININPSPNGPNKIPHDPRHLQLSIWCIQTNFWACGMLAQNVHLSCVKISTIPKQTEMSFHLSLVIYDYQRVHPKWFLSLWYVRRKPWYVRCKSCTYLALGLALSPNIPKQASTWASSPRRAIGCAKMIFEPMERYAQTVHLSSVKISTISKKDQH